VHVLGLGENNDHAQSFVKKTWRQGRLGRCPTARYSMRSARRTHWVLVVVVTAGTARIGARARTQPTRDEIELGLVELLLLKRLVATGEIPDLRASIHVFNSCVGV
jgi:hypothetical protein